ncbi:hypothetical protein UPYG_G00198360 [Umbra pygmaea]|uniref:Peptidase M12B domain-containing protein n=1 Tax=Umbra pygmaea TaxID=75934 RepID=A0ABD0WHN2_UMBPY
MCSKWVFVLALCAIEKSLSESFESENIVPVRINGRTSGRFWKRSEEKPRFRITAFGRDFILNLSPDNRFLSPTLKIQRIKTKYLHTIRSASKARGRQSSSGIETDFPDIINTTDLMERDFISCFYSGNVNDNQDSVVAVSLCYGILGSFVTDGNEYLIEPKVLPVRTEGSTEQLHVIKRTAKETSDNHTLFDQLSENSYYVQADGSSFKREDNDGQGEFRRKRFVSAPRFIETLVVADASMTHFYGDELKHYILTLVSMTAQLYKHASIMNSIHVVVVKILLVEDEEVGPSLSNNGGVVLRNFCAWQQLFNPASRRHPEHYDTALLFTREDICGHQSCDTLGVADVGTMCDPKRSCSVIEDNGLQASFTAAHELGHVLSMPHDDSKNCERKFGNQGSFHLMAPRFIHLNTTFPWSACSALHVTEFFDNGYGDCLLDSPESFLPLPSELPGTTYSLERQCQQVFGEEFVHCRNNSDSDICSQLWCMQEGKSQCRTSNSRLHWADGTPCGNNNRCLHGLCMAAHHIIQPKAVVDGSWSMWGPWQQCSRTCGGGVEFSYRECTDPIPQDGGKYCEGQRVQYQSCNTQACGANHGKSFREEQCEKYNRFNYMDTLGNLKQWIPKYSGVPLRDRCKLFCRAKGSSEFKVFEPKVVDGTTCGPDTTSVCVQGQCVKAGCDRKIGSNMRLDKCGVCGGNGLSCRKITGSYNKAIYGYSHIVTIPAGATNIDIKQRSHRNIKHDGNYLAIKRERGGYILNGNFSVSTVEQDVPVLGALLRYSGSSTTLERIQSFRQLRESVTVQLLVTAWEASPPKVKYTFFIPKDVSVMSKPKERKEIQAFGVPKWHLGEWSECSRSCGSGWSRRNVECRDNGGFLSNICDNYLKPADIRPCADLPCPIWQMGPWSSCSPTCGKGERRRSVVCMDYTGKIVEAEKCNAKKKPMPVSGECIYQDC